MHIYAHVVRMVSVESRASRYGYQYHSAGVGSKLRRGRRAQLEGAREVRPLRLLRARCSCVHAPPPLRDVQRRQLPSDDDGVCFLTAGRRCVCAVVVVGAVIPGLSPQTATSPPHLLVALWAARQAPVQWYHVIQTPCKHRTAADRCTGSQGRAHARVVARGQLRTCAHARLAPNDSRSTYWWQT